MSAQRVFDAAWTSKHGLAFLKFHTENPQVYERLCTLARAWTATGRRHLGIKMLFERARWDLTLATTGGEFKLNNNYTAFYARLIMKREKDLDGVFHLRKQS